MYGLTGRAVREGNYARLVLLDWDSEKIYSEYKSKGINTPYTNEKLTGSPRAIVTGEKSPNKVEKSSVSAVVCRETELFYYSFSS